MPRTSRRLRPVALTVAVFVLFILGTSTALALRREEPAPRPRERPGRAASPSRTAAAPRRDASYPVAGPGTWRYATSGGPVYGVSGPIRRYRVRNQRRPEQFPKHHRPDVHQQHRGDLRTDPDGGKRDQHQSRRSRQRQWNRRRHGTNPAHQR